MQYMFRGQPITGPRASAIVGAVKCLAKFPGITPEELAELEGIVADFSKKFEASLREHAAELKEIDDAWK